MKRRYISARRHVLQTVIFMVTCHMEITGRNEDMRTEMYIICGVHIYIYIYTYIHTYIQICGLGSVVGIATGYGQDGPGTESR